jgi:hypothetical protein
MAGARVVAQRGSRSASVTASVTAQERFLIEERAAGLGLPVSVYLRSIALSRAVPSHDKPLAAIALARVNDRLTRIANLLGGNASGRVAAALTEVEALQAHISAVAARL